MIQAITVASERALLTKHLDWIARQEWVDECYHELQALLGQLKATNGTAAPKAIARCYIMDVDGPCNGAIRVSETDGYAHCVKCRETWTGQQLAELHARIEELSRPRTQDGRAMMTVQQIVAAFGKNAKAVRMRLARYGVTAVDGHYDPAIFEEVSA